MGRAPAGRGAARHGRRPDRAVAAAGGWPRGAPARARGGAAWWWRLTGPPQPECLRRVWAEFDPARQYHQSLVAGSPVYLPTFGAMTPEQLGEMDSGTGLDRMLAARGAGAHSVMALPLIARGPIMGMVVRYRLPGPQPFTSPGLSLAPPPPAHPHPPPDPPTADRTDDETSPTCFYAVHDPAPGDWDLARAGHPQPALARPGHPAAFLDLPPGLPLGADVAGGGHYQTTRVHIPRHSTLVLYTDGLIENPAADLDTGMARLARPLPATSTLPISQACYTLP